MDDSEGLKVAVAAAIEGGKVALRLLSNNGSVGWKGLREAVPEGAVTVQDAVVGVIKRFRPDDAILAALAWDLRL